MSIGTMRLISCLPFQVDTNHLDRKYCVFPVLFDFPRLPLLAVDPVTMLADALVDLSDTALN